MLQGGTLAWMEAGLPLEQGETHLASPARTATAAPTKAPTNHVKRCRATGLGVRFGGPVGARWHAWFSGDLSRCINSPGNRRADGGLRLDRSAGRSLEQ